MNKTPAFFNEAQLEFKPLYEWAFGEKITHPETTARAESILASISRAHESFDVREPKVKPTSALRALHSYNLITLYTTASILPDDKTFHPNVFPRVKRGRGDPTNLNQAGAFCFDSGTPLSAQTLEAASWSAACAMEAANAIRRGERLAYALSRPPGHHATRDMFGGYCYFNNSALAARYLRRYGRVVVLDVDFHHGNGTQSLFYADPRVLTISVHGDPRAYFPYFAGYSEETGSGKGAGYNLNLPLPAGVDGNEYLKQLDSHIIPAITHFDPEFLVVAAGLDTYERDPMGSFKLTTADFVQLGERIGRLGLPTVAVQEGGYYTPHLGRNVVALLGGIRTGLGLD